MYYLQTLSRQNMDDSLFSNLKPYLMIFSFLSASSCLAIIV